MAPWTPKLRRGRNRRQAQREGAGRAPTTRSIPFDNTSSRATGALSAQSLFDPRQGRRPDDRVADPDDEDREEPVCVRVRQRERSCRGKDDEMGANGAGVGTCGALNGGRSTPAQFTHRETKAVGDRRVLADPPILDQAGARGPGTQVPCYLPSGCARSVRDQEGTTGHDWHGSSASPCGISRL